MTRRDKDSYPTPRSIIRVVLQRIEWPCGDVWEPCAGDGRFSHALQSKGWRVIEHDLKDGLDFFDWETAQASTIITNPPFNVMRNFIDHAFDIGVERMALVCNERLWACGKGHAQWCRHRPSRFVNMTWREDYLGKGGSPDRALAVSIWDTPHADECKYEVWNRDIA